MRPPKKRPSRPESLVCQAMRRSCSNSITVLDMVYGTPAFIDMPKTEPRASFSGVPSFTLTTEPDPSISGWREASATMAKMVVAGALMTRSTLTLSPSMTLPSTVSGRCPCREDSDEFGTDVVRDRRDYVSESVRDQVSQLHPLESGGVGGGQDDRRRHSG